MPQVIRVFNRNLSSSEIIGQVLLARGELDEGRLTNIVFMGMGEPLANYPEVIKAIKILNDPHGFNISRRRITVSTSGLVPQLYKLSEEVGVSLAVSLHAANDKLRDELVPINRKHPISELLDACWHYANVQNLRSVTFEYTMLKDVNDSLNDAKQLSKLFKRSTCEGVKRFHSTPFQALNLNQLIRNRSMILGISFWNLG